MFPARDSAAGTHEPGPGDVVPGAIVDSGGVPRSLPPLNLSFGDSGWGAAWPLLPSFLH